MLAVAGAVLFVTRGKEGHDSRRQPGQDIRRGESVDGVSFDVAKGEIFAFLGPNGAGKTTTIQMLTTLQRPTSGTMSLDGLDPVTNQLEARRTFGIVSRPESGTAS